MRYNFSNDDKLKIAQSFKTGAILDELARKFGCSRNPIGKIIIEVLGIKQYKEIVKKRLIENIIKRNKSEKGRVTSRENGQKYGIKNLVEYNFSEKYSELHSKVSKRAAQIAIERGNFISSWENKFYDEYLFPIFRDCDLRRQYYLPGLNHPFDFAIVECRILIEVDGDRWHGHSGNPEWDREALRKMSKIDKFAQEAGWSIYRYNDDAMRAFGILK